METLSIYRDFVTMFLEDIEARLEVNKWAKARAAINRKLRNNGKVNYRQNEIESILELNNLLQKFIKKSS